MLMVWCLVGKFCTIVKSAIVVTEIAERKSWQLKIQRVDYRISYMENKHIFLIAHSACEKSKYSILGNN